MLRKDTLLLTPGPTPVPARIAARIAEPVSHHRGEEFRSLWSRVNHNLSRLIGTASPVFTLASSGTGALEASVVNVFSKGETILSFSAGKWGERYGEIAAAHGLNMIAIKKPYGRVILAEDVAAGLAAHPNARGVLLTHCETSTGALNPIEEIGKAMHGTDALLLVDAVSGLACDPFRMDAWGVDVTVSASQKGLMLPPGLGFVALGPKALLRAESANLPNFYFDLKKALEAHHRQDSAFTPAVTLVKGLDEALRMILDEEELENVWARHARIAARVREELSGLGLAFLPSRAASGLTSIVMPEEVRSGDLLKIMKAESRVVMADGQGSLQGRLIRFAHMGDSAREDCAARGLEALTASFRALRQALETANIN